MKDSEPIIGRRDCLRISARAAVAMSMLNLGKASAQAPLSQGDGATWQGGTWKTSGD
jgi:hypothetical protein